MILVDTSVWIEMSRRAPRSMIPELLSNFATCGAVLQELFQGLRAGPGERELRESLLALPRLSDPTPVGTYLKAAELYRTGRSRGRTIRASTDCLIAAIAIENDVPVLHCDRDFSVIAEFSGLRAFGYSEIFH